MKKTIKIALYLISSILFPLILFFWEGIFLVSFYLFGLGIFLAFFEKHESKFFRALPFILGLVLLLLPTIQDLLSSKPEVHISINRIYRPNADIEGIIDLSNIDNYQIILMSSEIKEAKEILIIKKDIFPSDLFFWGIDDSTDKTLPYAYITYIENRGTKTKEKVYGTINLDSESFECKANLPNLNLKCQKAPSKFEDDIFFESETPMEKGDRTFFTFRTEKLEMPEVKCKYDETKCIFSMYDLMIFPVLSSSFILKIPGREIEIPDYSGDQKIVIYNLETREWDNYEKVYGREISWGASNSAP